MAEYRHNLITNRWVIIAPHRDARPRSFTPSTRTECPPVDPDCPFCPGNEKMTPPEVYALRKKGTAPDNPGWSVRVVPNKYPFLVCTGEPGDHSSPDDGHPAQGHHEVVIESPHHGHHFAHHTHDQTVLILQILRDRYRNLAADPHVRHIGIFCNHGRSSGASLAHPHFQIAAGTLLSPYLENHLHYCRDYYRQHRHSVFEKIIDREVTSGERIIAQNDYFLAICPWASMCPYEVYLLPREPLAQFGFLPDDSIPPLSRLLQTVLRALDTAFDDPDYNLVIHTAPKAVNETEKAYRWYIQLFPHLALSGGYELATDIYINATVPEEAADHLRDIL